MSDLSRDARDLIAQAKKDGLGPSAAERARVRERLTPLWAANAPAPSTRRGWPVRLVSVVVIAGLGALSWMSLGTTAPESSQPNPPLAAAASPTAEVASVADKSSAGSTPLTAAEAVVALPESSSRQPQARRAAAASRALDPRAPRPPAVAAAKTPALAQVGGARVHETASGEKARAACEGIAAAGDKGRGACQPTTAAGEKSRAACEGVTAASEKLRGSCEPAATSGETLRGAAAATGEEARTASVPAPAAGEKLRGAQRAAAGGTAGVRTPSSQQRLPLPAATTEARAQSVRSDQHPSPPSIEGELELLSAAQSALQQQRPSRALSLLQEHAFRFPTGALSEERMAMQALALCASGRKHAAQTVLVNLEAHGAPSQLLPRVRSQCGL